MTTQEIIATGKRKTSVATVRLFRVEGEAPAPVINGRALPQYFDSEFHRIAVMEPFKLCNLDASQFVIKVRSSGGGQAGQAGAMVLAISRALIELDENYKPTLRGVGFLTRDPRKKERKKYGRKKARKRFQFCKR